MANIKTISEIEVPQKWETVYEVDFRTQAAASWAGDGSGNQRAFKGVNWIAGNSAFADSISTTATEGAKIVMTGGEATNQWYSFIQTGPVIYASLDAICTAAGFTYDPSHTIVIQALCDFTITTAGTNAGYFFGGLYVGDGAIGGPSPNAGGRWYHTHWYGTEGTNLCYSRAGGGPGSGDGDNIAQTSDDLLPTFMELVIWPGANWCSSAGTNTTFPDPLTVSTGRAYGNMQLIGPPEDIGQSSEATITPGPSPEFTFRPGASSGDAYATQVGMFGSYSTHGSRDSAGAMKFSQFRVLRRNT